MVTRKLSAPALPRRQQTALDRPWDTLEEVPLRYLLAGIWAFLRASPGDPHERARLLGAWNQGEKGLLPILRELEPLWMESELISACPELAAHGYGDQRKRLLAHLLGLAWSTLWKKGGDRFGVRPLMASEIIPGNEDDPLPKGQLGWSAKDRKSMSRANAFAQSLAFHGQTDPRLTTITTHHRPGPFDSWVAHQAKESRELGAAFTNLDGCHIACGFMCHGVIKYARLNLGHLWLGYDFCFLRGGEEGSPRRLEFLAQAALHETKLKAPVPRALQDWFSESDITAPYPAG